MGFPEGCRVMDDVPKDSVIHYSDVSLPEGRLSDQLRANKLTISFPLKSRVVKRMIDKITLIKPPKGWQFLNLIELLNYTDLMYYLFKRGIKARYAQTILGISWALIQPLVQIGLFTLIFGKVARLDSEGFPYALFSGVAIIPWTFISAAISLSSQSLLNNKGMLGKVYFPREIFPITAVSMKLVDFIVSMLIIFFLFIYYNVSLSYRIVYLPIFICLMITISAGAGFFSVGISNPISRCQPCITICNSNANVYCASCLLGSKYTPRIPLLLFVKSHCKCYRRLSGLFDRR